MISPTEQTSPVPAQRGTSVADLAAMLGGNEGAAHAIHTNSPVFEALAAEGARNDLRRVTKRLAVSKRARASVDMLRELVNNEPDPSKREQLCATWDDLAEKADRLIADDERRMLHLQGILAASVPGSVVAQ